MGQAKGHNNSRFELEVLELRVLLSADVLLVSAVAANAVAHKPIEAAHQESFNGQGAFHDSLHYNPAGETGGIFDGVSGSAIHSHAATPAQTEVHNGDKNVASVELAAVQNSTSAVQPKAQVQAQAQVAVSSVATSTATTSNSSISASTTTTSGSSTAQQLTASLTAANGPPASVTTAKTAVNTSVSSNSSAKSNSTATTSSPVPNGNPSYVDLYATIQTDITAIANGGSTAPVTVTDVSLNGVVTFDSITLTFTVSSKTVTSVAFSATSAGLNLGGLVTATIGSVSGNYYVSATTVGGVNYSAKSFNLALSNLKIALSSFVSIGADSANLTYIGGAAGQSVNLVNPGNSTTPTTTDNVTMLTIGINGGYVFAGVNGTANASSTVPGTQANNYGQAANAEGLSITGVNLALALMSSTSSSGAVYYGLSASGGTVTLVGLPSAFSLSVSNLAVGVNGGNAAANGYAVDFSTTTGTGFTAGTGLTVQTGGTGSTPIVLDYNQPLVQASGTVDLNLSGFIYVMGTMYFQAGTSTTVNLTDGSTTTTGSVTTVNDNGGTASVSVLEIAATNVTVFAGVNGPTTAAPGVIPSNAIGVEIQNASFALVLMTTSAGVKYYGLQAGVGAANVITSGTKYNSSGSYTLSGLMPGETYQWTQGNPVSPSTTSGDTTLVAGSTTLTSSGTFVAPSNGTVTLTGTASTAVTASVAPLSGITALGLPNGITISSGTVSVSYNGTTSSTAPNEVVDFDSSFTTAAADSPNPRIGGLTIQTSTSAAYLDFTSPLVAVSGSLTLDFNDFIYVSGNIFFQKGGNTGGTLNLTTGTTTIASMLEVGASDVTIFAGVNGPSTNSAAVGMELDNAGFALALISGANGKTYYGLQATADSLSAIGLPSGFNLSGTDLGVAINGSNDSSNVVNFDTSFTTGTGLTVVTGGGNSVNLDFTTQLVQAYGSIDLQFSSYISISGSFNYSQTSGTSGASTTIILGSAAFTGAKDVTVTLGTGSTTLFTATGSLNMTITSMQTTIVSATLSVPELKVADVLDVVTPTVTLANISIDNGTGAISTSGNSTLTITAATATLFKGSTVLNGSVTQTDPSNTADNGLSGTFNLVSGAFAVTLEVFTLNVSTALQATATNVQITYSPGAGSSQQIVSISSLNAVFTGFGGGDIKGSITNLVIYGNGFKFDSATLSYTGDITVGSILKLTNPSVTLGNFSVTFDGSNTTLSASSLSVGVDSASLAIGAFTASATGLTISVSLTDGSTTIVAATLDFAFGSYLTLSATSIAINTNPDANGVTDGAYLTIGTATATLTAGSFSVTGSATSFSVIDHNGSAEFQAGSDFSITLTTPSASQLLLPSWLGFNVSKFEISWVDFNSNPGDFQITLSASITSIKGLPGGVTVSGEITDAVIDPSLLLKGEFPITSIGSVGGSVSGTLFGLEVNAAFVLGIVQFNAANQIVSGGVTPTVTKLTTNSDGSVTETTVTGGDTTVVNSIMYVGVAGGASIPGVGGVQIYIGFSSLGPLTFYLSAQFPLILDPDTGLAIGGFSGGVIFDYTIPTPGSPQDLATLNLSPASVSISQWQQQLRDQTVTQYTSSSGGTDLSAAYSQPFVIEAGVTLYDAYLSADAFTVTGNIAIQINPASPNSTSIFVSGTATFGASVSFNAYLYLNITVSGGSSTATVMFLGQAPAATPVETIGGSLQFGFVDSAGNPITPPTVASAIESEWIAAGATYSSTGTASIGSLQAGTYTWTPGTNDTSLTVGTTVYLATSATNGSLTFTTTSTQTASLMGTANTVISGTLSSAGNVTGAQYTINTFAAPAQIDGFYLSLDGFAQFSAFGTLTATVSGSVTLTVTSTFAKIDLSGDLSISTLGDLATASGEIVVDYGNGIGSLNIYGALKLATGSGFAKLENVGLYVDGAATFIINTSDSAQTVYLPDPHNPHIKADATEFDINDPQLFEVTIGGTTSGTFASLAYKAGGDTLLNMSGSFDLKISSSGLTMFADIDSLTVGPSASPFLTLSGFGLFVINSQGFAAEMDLAMSSDGIEGITFTAQFTLVMNTTGVNVVYTIPATLPPVTIPGSSSTTTRSLTIPAGPPLGALQSDGTYGTNVGPAGPYIVITAQGSLNIYNYSFTGFFYFQLSDSSAGPVVAFYVNVMGDLGFGNVNVTGGFELSNDGVVVLLQASGQVGPATSYGPGVSLVINAELAINTTNAAVSQIGGVALTDSNGNPLTIAAKSAQVVASGTLTMTFGPGSLVINGIFTTSLVVTGSGVTEVDVTTITANGTLTATVGGTVIFQRTALGVLVFSSPGPQNQNVFGTNGLGIAGELSLSASGSSPLSGTGFSFTGTFDLEINTTEEAQSVTVPGLSSPVIITAGPNGSSFGSVYAEIHAYGTMLFGSNAGTALNPVYTGFALNGDFYLTVGSAGLAVSANVTLGIYVAGSSLLSVNAQAAMAITPAGLAASLVVTAGVSDPDGLYGFGGTLSLQVNTTGVQQTIGTVIIPAAPGGSSSTTGTPYFQIYISGTLALGTTDATIYADSTGMYVSGNFYLTISPAGLSVVANGTLTAYVGGTPLLTMQASGALIINAGGIAGELTLTVNEGDPLDSSGLYSFSGSFNLQLNTTGNNYYIGTDGTIYNSIPAAGTTYTTLSAGPQGATTGGFYFEVEASGTLTFGSTGNGFSLAGNLYMSVGSEGLAVSANAAFTANVLNKTLLTMNASGAFIITASGIAGELTLTFGVGSANPLNGVGFAFTGGFSLVVNTTGINYYVGSDGSISMNAPTTGTYVTIAAGQNGDTDTPGNAYFEIDANGTLLFGTAANGFALTGDLFLSVGTAGLAVSTNDTFSVTVGGTSVISLTASGAMEITSAGLAASLTLTASSGNSLFTNQSGFGFSGLFTFQLNTTNKAVNDMIGDTALVLAAGPYFQIYVSGALGLGTSNTSAPTGMFLNGTFYLTISSNGLAIAATTNLTAVFNGTTLLTLGAKGGLILTSGGLAGAISLTIGSSNPLSGTGFSFTGTFTLQVNTTHQTYYFWSNGTVSTNAPNGMSNPGVSIITTVSAGPGGSNTGSTYFQVYASGAIVFGTSSNGFSLSGSFFIAIGTTGLSISVSTTFTASVLGTQLISVSASGAMEITSAGLAASLSLTVPSLGIAGVFSLTGTVAFQINTTNQAVNDTVGGVALSLPKGPYFQLSVTGASLTFLGGGSGFGLTNGSFILSIGSAGMAISASATLNLTIASVNIATFTATGALLVTSNGIAAKLDLTLTSGFSQAGSTGFSFSANFELEINTTSSAINTINNQTVSIPRGPFFEILASGSLMMGGVLSITGSFTFTLNSTGVLISMNASVNVFGVSFTVNGFAAIYSSGGIALQITLSVGNSSNPTVTLIPGILALSGSFVLQVNTTGNSSFNVNGTNYSITPHTIFNISISASLNVFGFSLATASINIALVVSGSNSYFTASGTTSFNFFGFATFGVDFYFSANLNNGNVQYWFYGGIYLQLGSSGFNIHGSLTFEVSSFNTTDTISGGSYYGHSISSGLTIRIDGGVTAFGFNFGSIGASININGTSVSFSVYVSVSFYFFSIGGTVTIHLGSISPVPSPPPPPTGTVIYSSTTIDGVAFGAGTLLINVGQYANSNRGVAPQANENYTITYVSTNSDGTENITVTAVGVNGGAAETYNSVKEIVIPDADIGSGTSNMNVTISGAITLPVVIFAGSGKNTFNLGSSTATVNGTDGNDTVNAGSGFVTFYAGSGQNKFNGSTGGATITGSSGNDTIIGGTGNVTFTVGSGSSTFTGGGTGSTHNTIIDPGNVNVIENNYSSYTLTGTSATAATLTYGGNTDTLTNTDGGITLSLKGTASGAETFTATNYSGNVTFDAAGNTNVATTVTVATGNMTVNNIGNLANTITESNGTTGTITLQSTNSSSVAVAYGAVTLNGGATANTITVNSWSGSGALTLNGMGGSDNYIINFQSSGSFTVNVNDSGTSGTDVMTVNGTASAATLYVNNSSVTLGTQIANYTGVENLTVNTAADSETVDVSSTSAATTINTGGYTDTINIGSNAATTNTGGTLNNIITVLTINGTGSYDTLNLDDTGDTTANTGTLTGTTLSGVLGANGSLAYSNIKALNLNLGTGADTLYITATSSVTNINASLGTSASTLDIGSNEPSVNSVLSNLRGALTITGNANTIVNVDDTGDAAAATGVLTGTTLKGLGMVSNGITYSGLKTLNISLGINGNFFTITNTHATTATTLNSGSGKDTINVTTDSGVTIINGNGGGDTVNVTTDGGTTTINEAAGNNTINLLGTGATTYVNTSNGSNVINIGSKAPSANGIVNLIQGAIYLVGSGTDTANVGDTGSKNSKTGQLTSTTLTGLNMVAGGITYSGLKTLIISLGSGGNTFNVLSTYSGTTTTVNTGMGVNTVTVTSNAPTNNASSVLTGIAGSLIITGQGLDTLNVDDTGDTGAGVLTQTVTTLTGLGMGASGITYTGVDILNINLGAHGNTVYIQGNPVNSTENLNTGTGTNIISIGSAALSAITTNPLTGNATNTGSVLDNVQGIINITGSGTDTINVDDSGSTTADNGGMWSNKLQFLNPAVTINFSGIAVINIALSEAGDQFAISDTFTSASVTPVVIVDGDLGNDTFVIFDTHAVMTINGGDGDDNFYDFGNSAVMNLNGNANDDTFYVYASVSSNTTNVGPGAADSNGNQVYSYRVNAAVNIDGGTGNDRVFIFGTVLNDVITITSTSVTGAGIDVNFTNVEQLTVAGLGGDDTFYIESIAIPTTIIGDGTIVLPSVAAFLAALGLGLPNLNGNAPPATSFNDSFYVGWQGANYIPGSLAGINSTLTIMGDNGPGAGNITTNFPDTNDTIYVDDSGDTFNRNYTLSPTTLTSNAMGANGLVTYDIAVENFNMYVGQGTNTITVNGNTTGSQMSLYGGRGNDNFIVNDTNPLQSPLAIIGGTNTFVGDTLTVNGGIAGNTYDLTGYTIDGQGATISYQEIEKLTINAVGATTFNVIGDSVPTYLNGGSGNDTFTVNSNTTSLYLNGGTGNETFVINGNSGALTATATIGTNSFTVNGNGSTLIMNGGSGVDSFVINANSGTLTANGNAGADIFVVNALSSPATLNGGTGDDTFTVNTPLAAVLTVNGGGDAGDLLIVNGTIGNDYFTITNNAVNGIGSAILYNTVSYLTVNGVAGNDTFLILTDSATTTTTLNGSTGNDLFYVRMTSGPTIVNTGGGINTVDIGANEPYTTGNILDGIQGAVTVNGGDQDVLNIDDSASTTNKNGILTATTLTGLGMGVGGITYYGIPLFNLKLGSGSDTLNVRSTNATTVYNVNLGAGANIVNIGSLTPTLTGGIVDAVQGTLNLTGSGNDTLNVDDTGSTLAKTGAMTSSTITGLGMGAGGVTYVGFTVLNISLGSGGNTFTITSTLATTVTTLNSGSSADTVNLLTDSDTTNINGQGGNDTINIQTTGATTNVNTGSGTNVVNIGSLAPAVGGVLNNIQGTLNVTGSGTDTLNVDDTGSTAAKNGTMTSSTITGLGMGSGGINYTGLATLNIKLGSGNDTFNVQSTNASTINNLNTGAGTNVVNVGSLAPAVGGIVNNIQGTLNVTGSGTDTLNVDDTGSTVAKTGILTSSTLNGLAMGVGGITYTGLVTLSINLGSGSDTFNVQSTYVSTVNNLNTGSGTNVVNVGSLAPAVGGITNNIQGTLNVTGSGSDTLNVNDTGSTMAKTGAMTSSTITGLGMGVGGITYTGLATLNISLGSGGNTFTITSTYSATVTTLNSGSGVDTVNLLADSGTTNINGQTGNDTINIQTTGATTNVNTGVGTNVVNIGSLAPAVGGKVNGIQGTVNVTGSGTDTMNVDDTGSTAAKTGVLTSSTITGQGMGVGGITYTGLANLNISLGSGGNTFTINSTYSATVTTLNSGSNDDTVNLLTDSGVTNINGQTGNDTINIQTTGATTNVNTGSGTNVVNVGSLAPAVGGITNNIQGTLNVTGSGSDTLNVDDTGSTAAKTGAMTSSTITGLGMGVGGINYTGLAALNISLGSGGNTFTINSTFAATVTTLNSGSGADTVNLLTDSDTTNVNSQAGNDTINIQATGATTNVNTGSGTNTVNVGSLAPAVGGKVNGIQGTVNVTGSGTDIMNVDDTGSTTSKTGAMTSSTITGLGMGVGGITYTGLATLNIKLGSGSDTFNVQSTYVSTVTNLNTGSGANVVNIGSQAPAVGGIVDGVQGTLNVTGSGNDMMNVDDTGSTLAKTGAMTSSTITGLGMGVGGITYTGLSNLNISLGSGGNTFMITSTFATTVTRLNSGSGDDTVNLLTDSGITNINAQDGNDVVNVQTTGATTNVNTGTGTNTVNVGSLAPAVGGIVDNIQGTVNVSGSGTDTLNVDDTGSTAAKTGTLTANTLTGLGMGAGGITYSGLAALNITLGSGGNTFTIVSTSTNAATVTTLNSGSGNDTVNLLADYSITNINTQAGNDVVNVQTTGATTNVNTGAGTNVVNVGSLAPAVGGITNNIQGTLNVTGSGTDTMNVDDTGSATAKTGAMTSSTITGLGMGAGGITYTGLTALNITLGSGGNTFTIGGTSTATTRVHSGNGNDTYNIQATTGTLYVNGDGGSNTFNLGSLAPVNGGTLNNLTGAIFITGGSNALRLINLSSPGTNIVNLDDSGDSAGNAGTLTSSTLTGLGLGGGVTFVAVNLMNLKLGAGNDTFNVQSTNASTVTNLNTGGGTNIVNVGSLAPVIGSVVIGIQGTLNVTGNGTDTLNVDDTGSTAAKTGTLTSSTLTGLGLGAGGITYTGLANLNISLGSGGNTFAINSTKATTVTTLNSGAGSDTVNLLADSGVTNINTQAGNDTINIKSTGAMTNVNTGAGTNTLNIGSLAPAFGGIVNNILGTVNVTGSGGDILNVDDTGSTTAKTGAMTSSTITGLGMGVGGITYTGLATLNIKLGSGNDTFNVQGTSSGTVTNLNTGAGANIVNIGSLTPATGGIVNNIQGTLNVTGSGNDTMNVDDTGSTTAKNGLLTATTLTGLGVSVGGINYSGLIALNINLGAGSDTFTITGVTNTTVTTVNGGTGTNTAIMNFSGNFAGNLTLLNFVTGSLYVGGNFSGTLTDDGALTLVTIVGSLTTTGILNAGSIATMTVGVDLAGLLNVTGLLGTLTITGGSPGKIVVGSVNVINVLAGYGNKVLQVITAGIERDIMATPVAGGTMPNTVHFAIVYDGQTASDPQAAIRVTDNSGTIRSYNVALVVVNSSTAKFNLSRLDSVAATGISNISVQGDLLTKLTTPELALFTDLNANSPGGVSLATDNITGVEVSGKLPEGFINVAGIEGLAFSTLTTANGATVTVSNLLGTTGGLQAFWAILGSHAALNSATDILVVPFVVAQPVSVFAHIDNNTDMALVLTLSDRNTNNLPLTAYVQLAPLSGSNTTVAIQSLIYSTSGGNATSPYLIRNTSTLN